jgi:putative ABC transport system permease protein
MLFGERAKYTLLLSGIAAATVLMVQGVALGYGILSFSYATADNVRSPIWVVDPVVQQVNDNHPLRETDVDRVRSVDEVGWAVPLYVGNATARIVEKGVSKAVFLVGLDASTLMGAPQKMLSGVLSDPRLPDAVIIDESATRLLSSDSNRPLGPGDTFEMNDHLARVVGVCFAKPSLGGGAYVFTTYDRAVQYVPNQRKMVTLCVHELRHLQQGRK